MPAMTRRVEQNNFEDIDRARQSEIQQSLRYHAARPGEIPARLAELDREWDVERVIEAHTAIVALAGLSLGAFVNRKFLILTGAVSMVLMLHAIQGWCPRVAVLRRLGFRTKAEIYEERCGLAMLRGEQRISAAPATTRWTAPAEEIHEGVE